MQQTDWLLIRWLAAGLLALKVLDDFFATALTIAYRVGASRVAEALGGATPGDDYRRFIPLMEAVPAWLHGLWVSAGLLYLAAIAGIVRRRTGVHILVLVAVGIEVVATLAGRAIAASTGVVPNPDAGGPADVVRLILPLLLALVLWQSGRRTLPPTSAAR